MKIKNFAYAIALCLVTSQLFSCTTTGTDSSCVKEEGVISFVSAVDSCVLLSEDGGVDSLPLYVTATASIIIPTSIGDNEGLNLLIDSIGQVAFGKTGDLKEAMAEYLKQPEVADSITVEVIDKLPEDLSWLSLSTEDISGYVKNLSATVLTYCVNKSHYYAGAAHGMYTASYVNFYIPDGVVITAENMFVPEKEENILNAINAVAKSKFGESLMDPIERYNNFYLDAENQEVVFVYQPYEVASYAQGIVEVPLAGYLMEEDGCLTPIGKNVLGIKY